MLTTCSTYIYYIYGFGQTRNLTVMFKQLLTTVQLLEMKLYQLKKPILHKCKLHCEFTYVLIINYHYNSTVTSRKSDEWCPFNTSAPEVMASICIINSKVYDVCSI